MNRLWDDEGNWLEGAQPTAEQVVARMQTLVAAESKRFAKEKRQAKAPEPTEPTLPDGWRWERWWAEIGKVSGRENS